MIIDGKKIAEEKLEVLKKKVAGMAKKPKLAIVLVGDDPARLASPQARQASKIYVNLKVKRAAEIGVKTEVRQDLNTDADGIIVQLPGGENLIDQIPLEKDVDGLRENSPFLPATVRAVLTLINNVIPANAGISKNRFRVKPGMTWGVIGQGRLIGKPLADYLEKNNLKVIRCDEFTKDLKSETLKADILVVATGVSNLIKADMVKRGAVVIDCGAPKAEVDFEKVKDVASAITPVPGGVGPMTVACLLENLVECAYNSNSSHIRA